MAALNVILCIVGILIGILQIVLFFKVWGMTNDVKSILFIMKDGKSQATEAGEALSDTIDSDSSFKTGQLVIEKKTETQFRITSLVNKDGKHAYYSEKLNKCFMEDEIEDFDSYWAEKK